MIIKKSFICALFISPYISASQPLIPSTIHAELLLKSDPNPGKINITIDLPQIAEAPHSAGKAALLTIGGLGALTCIYQGIKKLDKDKKTGLGLIGSGILGFIALFWVSSSKWFTCHQ